MLSNIFYKPELFMSVVMEGNVKDAPRSVIWITNRMKYQIIIVILLSADQLSECVCVCTEMERHFTKDANNWTWMQSNGSSLTLWVCIYEYICSISLALPFFFSCFWEIWTLLTSRGDAQLRWHHSSVLFLTSAESSPIQRSLGCSCLLDVAVLWH